MFKQIYLTLKLTFNWIREDLGVVTIKEWLCNKGLNRIYWAKVNSVGIMWFRLVGSSQFWVFDIWLYLFSFVGVFLSVKAAKKFLREERNMTKIHFKFPFYFWVQKPFRGCEIFPETSKNIRVSQTKRLHILVVSGGWYYLPTPPLGQDMTQRSIFKRSLTGLNSEFSFS